MKISTLQSVVVIAATLYLSACDPQKMDAGSLGAASSSTGGSSGGGLGSFDLVQDDFADGEINSVVFEVEGNANGNGSFNNPITFSYNNIYNFTWNSTSSVDSNVKLELFSINDPTVSATITNASCGVGECDAEFISCYFVGFNGVLESALAYCFLGTDQEPLNGPSMAELAQDLNSSLEELPLDTGIRLGLCDSSGENCDIANLGYVTLTLEDK